MEAVVAETMTIANRMYGNAIWISINRSLPHAIHLFRAPETKPIIVPTVNDPIIPKRETIKETLAPLTIRLKISLPRGSVPSM